MSGPVFFLVEIAVLGGVSTLICIAFMLRDIRDAIRQEATKTRETIKTWSNCS